MPADTRPTYSVVPAHLRPVLAVAITAASTLIEETFAGVMRTTADRLTNELENDALSIAAQVVASAGIMLVDILQTRKGIPLAVAAKVLREDLLGRFDLLVELAQGSIDAGTATRQ